MSDPLVLLAKQRIIKASADLEVQLSEKNGGGPAIEILRRLRDRAAESLAALATVDAEDAKAIRMLQNEVKKYDEWVGDIRSIIAEGVSLDREMQENEREELLDVLVRDVDGEQQAVALGLIDAGPTD